MSKYTPVKLAYKSYEPTTGGIDEKLSPVIFLHGASGSKEIWRDIPQTIADRTKRKAYAVDARNHGDSEWSDVFNFDINADDLLHFMDTISVQKAVLVGHSMGGITSIRAALKIPERIEMLFVEDMYVKKLPQQHLDGALVIFDVFRSAIEHIPSDCPEDEATGYIIKYMCEKVPGFCESLSKNDQLSKVSIPLKRDAEGRYLLKANMDVIQRAMRNEDSLMSEPEGLYEGPAYFIYGAVSQFHVPEEEQHIKKFFPNAELIGVENADHGVHTMFPERFTEILLKYL